MKRPAETTEDFKARIAAIIGDKTEHIAVRANRIRCWSARSACRERRNGGGDEAIQNPYLLWPQACDPCTLYGTRCSVIES